MKYLLKYTIFVLVSLLIQNIMYSQQCDSINATIGDMFNNGEYTPASGNNITFAPTASPPAEGDKAIYWIHGMNGSDASWRNPAIWTDLHYRTVSSRPNYLPDQDFPFNTCAFRLGTKIILDWNSTTKSKTDPNQISNSFAIGHSLGGVTIRKVSELMDPEPINGIVTFNSPHGGTELAKFVRPAFAGTLTPGLLEMNNVLGKNSVDIMSGPILEYILLFNTDLLDLLKDEELIRSRPFFGSGFSFKGAVSGIGKILKVPFIIANLVSLYQSGNLGVLLVRNSSKRAVGALTPGSSTLNIVENIPSTANDAHRVAISSDITTGFENTHFSVYRMGYCSYKGTANVPVFTANLVDRDAIATYNRVMRLYEDKEAQMKQWYSKKHPLTPDNWYWGGLATWGEIRLMGDLYHAGFEAFTSFNDYYEVITGARTYHEVVSNLGDCKCGDRANEQKITHNVSKVDCVGASPIPGQHECQWYPYRVSYGLQLEPYDGLLTAQSMQNWNNHDLTVKRHYTNSNHVTIKNDRNTRTALTDLYRGRFGEFFRTSER